MAVRERGDNGGIIVFEREDPSRSDGLVSSLLEAVKNGCEKSAREQAADPDGNGKRRRQVVPASKEGGG